MTDLSPAALAVLYACNDAVERLPLSSTKPEQFSIALIAAALEAVADQVVPARTWPEECKDHLDYFARKQVLIRNKLLAIAAELEAIN